MQHIVKRRALALIALLLPIAAFVTVYLAWSPGQQPAPGEVQHVRPAGSAASEAPCRYHLLYYDPLWLEHPNETLIRVIREIVEETGGCMDAYVGARAGLAPLLHLDSYDIVVIRAHGGIWAGRGFYFATGLSPLGPYDVPRSLLERLVSSGAVEAGSPAVFSGGAVVATREYIVVGARFFEKLARFHKGAVVILESCDSLTDPRFVSAVLDAGAGVYIGWTGKVTPRDIDDTLPSLLRLVVSELGHPCEIAKSVSMRLVESSTGALLGAVCRRG